MAFTMHSHSGQFCPGHAKNQLEDIIKHAITIGYKTMGLSEHMPRHEERDLYPEELDDKDALNTLATRHQAYLTEAQRLQAKYAAHIHILIGFECDYIRPSYASPILELASPPCVDYFVGSVHHVYSIPIDYSKDLYLQALQHEEAQGSEQKLWGDYYDLQQEMLTALKPKVVGHFDLIRLLSAEPDRNPAEWEPVWSKIVRNLETARQQGCWLECNSAALRKGLQEPYPGRQIAQEWIKMGGKFTMSDDSHGIDQVATNYGRALDYLAGLGVTELWTLRRTASHETQGGKAKLEEVTVPISTFKRQFEHN